MTQVSRPAGLRIVPVSDRALIVEYPDLAGVLAHYPPLVEASLLGVDELVPAASTVMVRYDPAVVSAAELAKMIRAVAPKQAGETQFETVTIDVSYDGEDLADVAGLLQVSVEELINRHTAAHWEVAFVGFAPGFSYCQGDDELFDVPRRSSPRTRIPAGSVGLAGTFSAVYPRESPGGWQLLGHSAAQMWSLDRDPPALAQPGQPVRYRAVREQIMVTDPAAEPPELGDAWCEAVSSGPQMLLEDLGRPGLLGQGVAASGAADRGALMAANRAVGNDPGTAALEIAGGGAELRFEARTLVGVAGADGPRSIISETRGELDLPDGVPMLVEPGDVVRIGGFTRGLRAYLAVRRGFGLEPILGSLATDTLSGVGPDPLRSGDRLPIGGGSPGRVIWPDQVPSHQPLAAFRPPAAFDEIVELRVVLGPRTDWFTSEAIELLTGQEWLVTPQSDRVGVRLEGKTPLDRVVTRELPSEGAAAGAIQVPSGGQPVLFLPDHPLTGGYPIIGSVADADLDRIAQLVPGMKIRFVIDQPFVEL
ncbi:urea amidolyase family protein [Propionimicrobium sp. PCR01-08-3]|uniref:5-oxoprolinase subunit B/C family protein n=1 Tax=Propionimicrobium sp. PCR01-08-3 TaxID=3052086 RepID=UPI00255C3E5D|nr:urea amidolyase family protein [Propionimicrobium sp. PCR01-08-3]WIY82459.1 urea amidolyase family protein [Propionimicrobium sp. PCR01-08-3]